MVTLIKAIIHTQEEEHPGPMGQEEEHQQEEHPHQKEVNPGGNAGRSTPPGHTPTTAVQAVQAAGVSHSGRYSDPWAPLDRSMESSTEALIALQLQELHAYWTSSRLLEAWSDKSTFAIATWRADAQRYDGLLKF